MAKVQKNFVKIKKIKPKQTKSVLKKKEKPKVVSEKQAAATAASKKKENGTDRINTPRLPIVFISPKTEDTDEEDDSEVEETTPEQTGPKLPVVEPIPTDVPDPQLSQRLQNLIRPLIAYVYNEDQMTLKLSFEEAGMLLEPDYNEQTKVFRFLVNTKEICQAVGEKAEAHSEARDKLVQIIRYYCYTVKRVKDFHTRRKIFHARPPNPPKNQRGPEAIQEENIGFKMLQKQGWSGGALGANEDGIIEPIAAKQRKGKSGLGTENATKDAPNGDRSEKVKIPLEAFYMMMKQYAGVNALYDLVFSTQFTKHQVVKLKAYAESLKLVPRMVGQKKRLVVSRPLTIKQIKEGVMKGHSDLCAKYVVIPPAAGIPEEDKVVIIKPKKEKT
ncbi:NF-kappa-B-repressing factor-like [Anopheles ziemanni]|uniref:NF-kappa-B-repressing factor-like n=1 Tax=Anopheles coustani TaxID=139045 RepID=UPI002659CA15|nr:NF-kappa-B-repressing factor-like [Anopheles coustani]XP_058172500.1 NF-kappa-B-repressing factor-like [Anopheles ziemanni]